VEIPVDPQAPDRFSRRYEFLTYTCRDLWIAWLRHALSGYAARKALEMEGSADVALRIMEP
jgi:hypothetical protein